MRIGLIVQGSTDRAFLTGLRDRWCPGAKIEEALFRGTDVNPRQYRKACYAAYQRGVEVMVILTDSDSRRWEKVHEEEAKSVAGLQDWLVMHGVADRNVECWICAETSHVAKVLGVAEAELQVNNPKGVFERTLGITRYDKKESEIAEMVRDMPSMRMMIEEPSFKRFYETVRDFSQRLGCAMPNEHEAGAGPPRT